MSKNNSIMLKGTYSKKKYEFYTSEAEARKEINAYKKIAKTAKIKLPKIYGTKGYIIQKPSVKGKAARLFKDFGV